MSPPTVPHRVEFLRHPHPGYPHLTVWGIRIGGTDLRVLVAEATRALWSRELDEDDDTPQEREQFLLRQHAPLHLDAGDAGDADGAGDAEDAGEADDAGDADGTRPRPTSSATRHGTSATATPEPCASWAAPAGSTRAGPCSPGSAPPRRRSPGPASTSPTGRSGESCPWARTSSRALPTTRPWPRRSVSPRTPSPRYSGRSSTRRATHNAPTATPNWHKSTYSGADNDSCIEVADNLPRIHVRDTKDHSQGELTATPTAWAALTAFARADTH